MRSPQFGNLDRDALNFLFFNAVTYLHDVYIGVIGALQPHATIHRAITRHE
jgi:hypothetical protein